MSGGPYGPEGEPPPPPPLEIAQNSLILDFNCQPLRRVPICFMSVGPYGPGGVLGKVFSRKDPMRDLVTIFIMMRVRNRDSWAA